MFPRGGSLQRLALQTGAPMAMVDVESDGTVVLDWVNPAMAALLGLGDGDQEGAGSPLADLLAEESGLRLGAAARDLVRLQADSTSVQVDVVRRGRAERVWLHLLTDAADGRPAGTAHPGVLHAGPAPAALVAGDDDAAGHALLVQRLSEALLRLRRRPARVGLAMAWVRRPADGAGTLPDLSETAELTRRVRQAARDTDHVVLLGPGLLAVLAEDPVDDGGIAMARRVLEVLHQPVRREARNVVTVAVLEVADADADPEAVLDHLGEARTPGVAVGGLTVLSAWERGRRAPRPITDERDAATQQRIRSALESGHFVLGQRVVRAPAGGPLPLPRRREAVDRDLPRTATLVEVNTVDDGVLTPVRVDAAGLAAAIDHWALSQIGRLGQAAGGVVVVRLQPRGSLTKLHEAVEDVLRELPDVELVVQVPEPRLAEEVSAQRAALGGLRDLGVTFGVSDWTGRLDVRALVRGRIGLVELARSWEQDVLEPDGAAVVTGLVAGLRAGLGAQALVVTDQPTDARSAAALAGCGAQWTVPEPRAFGASA